jgi:hypothetical protein
VLTPKSHTCLLRVPFIKVKSSIIFPLKKFFLKNQKERKGSQEDKEAGELRRTVVNIKCQTNGNLNYYINYYSTE